MIRWNRLSSLCSVSRFSSLSAASSSSEALKSPHNFQDPDDNIYFHNPFPSSSTVDGDSVIVKDMHNLERLIRLVWRKQQQQQQHSPPHHRTHHNQKDKNLLLLPFERKVREPPGVRGKYKIVIEDLPSKITPALLKEAIHKLQVEKNGKQKKITPFDLQSVEFFTDRWRGRNRQNAFVYFSSEKEVEHILARASMFGIILRGKRCSVYPSSTKSALFVGNLPWELTEEAQISHKLDQSEVSFPICAVEISLDAQRRSKGFAFFKFASHYDALVAYRALMHDNRIFGRALLVRWASMVQQRSIKETFHVIRKLQEENYQLRLDNEALRLKIQHLIY